MVGYANILLITVAAIITACYLTRPSIKILLTVIAFIAFDGFIANNIIDFSADGISYHYYAIRRILENNYLIYSSDVRINSSPPLPYLISLVPILFIKLLIPISENLNSSGKISMGVLLFSYAHVVFRDFRTMQRLMLSIITAFPPIFSSQFLTGYVDYYTYLFAAFISISIYAVLINRGGELLLKCHSEIFILSFSICAVLKYQSILFCIVILPIVFLLFSKHIYKKIELKSMMTVFIASFAVVSVIDIIWFAYVYFNFGSLVPTVATTGVNNILYDNEFYRDTPKYLHFIHSFFSGPELNADRHDISTGISGLLHPLRYGFADLRFGSYGPFVPIITLLLLIIAFRSKSLYYIALYIISLIAILPGIGNSRYYSFLHLLPIILLLYTYKKTLFYNNVISLIFISQLFVLLGSMSSYLQKVSYLNKMADELSKKPVALNFAGWYYYKNILSNQYKITFIKVDKWEDMKCESIKNKFANTPLHDEIQLCENK